MRRSLQLVGQSRAGAPRCLPAVVLAVGCTQGTPCESDDTACDSDANAVDSDSDVAPPVDRAAELTLELDTTVFPSDATAQLVCDGRTLVDVPRATAPGTRAWVFPVRSGEACTVTLEDARGGRLPAGRLYNCSVAVATWESQRGTAVEVASHVVEGCSYGCVDPVAENYDPRVNADDGSCDYLFGCTNADALNFDAAATRDDGSCDFGGFGRVEVFIHTDDSPTDTSVRLVCQDRDALTLGGLTTAWTTQTAVTNVDAGFDCTVLVADSAGDVGPAGRVESCGRTVIEWDALAGQGDAWEVEVGTLRTEACSGCTDPSSPDHDPTAVVDDGSCTYP